MGKAPVCGILNRGEKGLTQIIDATRMVVLVGKIGGDLEERVAKWYGVKKHPRKIGVSFIGLCVNQASVNFAVVACIVLTVAVFEQRGSG
jgi:succinyl-CoA synthetase alpha subunit